MIDTTISNTILNQGVLVAFFVYAISRWEKLTDKNIKMLERVAIALDKNTKLLERR